LFERFTDRARQVLAEAQAEAVETGVGFIGTEHLLIGMLREGTGVAGVALAAQGITLEPVRGKVAAELLQYVPPAVVDRAAALASIGIDVDEVRRAVEAAFGEGALPDPATQPPFTARARQCLELALAASLRWRHRYIGTEHLLVGVLDEGDGLAVTVLRDLEADLTRLRDYVKKLADPAVWRADHAWDQLITLMRRVSELPDGHLKEELRAQQRTGFDAVSEENATVRAAADILSARLETINTGLERGLTKTA
jgi:ATP-dependent Clp protease ATP-binding subunit ClpA